METSAFVKPVASTVSLKEQIVAAKNKLKSQDRRYRGLIICFLDGDSEDFPRKSRRINEVIDNLNKQDPEAFEVFTTRGDYVCVKQVKWVPAFFLL